MKQHSRKRKNYIQLTPKANCPAAMDRAAQEIGKLRPCKPQMVLNQRIQFEHDTVHYVRTKVPSILNLRVLPYLVLNAGARQKSGYPSVLPRNPILPSVGGQEKEMDEGRDSEETEELGREVGSKTNEF